MVTLVKIAIYSLSINVPNHITIVSMMSDLNLVRDFIMCSSTDLPFYVFQYWNYIYTLDADSDLHWEGSIFNASRCSQGLKLKSLHWFVLETQVGLQPFLKENKCNLNSHYSFPHSTIQYSTQASCLLNFIYTWSS